MARSQGRDLPGQMKLPFDAAAAGKRQARPTGIGTVVITRRAGEGILIGEPPDTVLVMVRRAGREPALAVTAPRHVRIRRAELDPRAA